MIQSQMDLPKVNDTPTRHPGFCLSISTKLIHTLTSVLTTNAPSSSSSNNNNLLVLSVGSGSGLLEAHLLNHLKSQPQSTPASQFTVQGVEVRSSLTAAPVNKYLLEQHSATVRGTWELSPLLEEAVALFFVYPRNPSLVNQYLEARPASLRVVLWLGPCADWEVFGRCFQDLEGFGDVDVLEGGNAGVAEFEMIAVVRRC